MKTRRKTIPVGSRFGHLVVIGEGAPDGVRSTSIVKCDCGNIKKIKNTELLNKGRISCGCAKGDNLKTHGQSKTRLFKIWANMIERCYTDRPRYKHYFHKGIRVCDEWRNSFVEFRKWSLAHGYADNLSIDRIDPNGNYEPSNCRWITMADQMNNRTTSVFLTAFGETHTISEWSRITGIREGTIRSRISRSRWSAEKALSEKTKQGDENAHHAN